MTTPTRYEIASQMKGNSERKRNCPSDAIGNACNASRAIRNALSPRKPWSTSCMIGRQVKTSSTWAADSRWTRTGRANTSIQTEASTRYTAGPVFRPGLAARLVVAYLGQIPLPKARTGQLQNATCLRPSNEFRHRSCHCSRVGTLAAEPQGFFQYLFVTHKVCALHVYLMNPRPGSCQWVKRALAREATVTFSARL